MNTRLNQVGWMVLLPLGIGIGLGRLLPPMSRLGAAEARAQEKSSDKAGETAVLRAELEMLKGKAADQAHVMSDVGYHFGNLWFAGQNRNWPLAKFYLDETRSHLKWAVRIIPVRKTKAGDLDLNGILQGLDNTLLSQIQRSIEAKDSDGFAAAYKQTVEGCYACHKAVEKPFLRLRIPEQPEARMMNFDPEARWPQ